MPKWIFDVFSDWQKVSELQTRESRNLLNEIAQTANSRGRIEALISLVSNNYSLQMFDLVEGAKRRLSEDMATVIRFKTPDFSIAELVTRSEFEKIIWPEIKSIEQHLNLTLAESGLHADEIGAVIRTGGSSTIPAFRHMLIEKFGREKVLSTDTFSSVTSGLGIIAHGIAAGEIEAEAHTPGGQPALRRVSQGQRVPSVNLALIQRRLAAQEEQGPSNRTDQVGNMVLLSTGGQLSIIPLNKQQDVAPSPIPLAIDWLVNSTLQAACWASLDEPLLMVSSHYRFFLITAGELLELDGVGLDSAAFLHLQPGEQLTAVNRWSDIRKRSRLALISTRGYARTYHLNGLIEAIEGPTPHQFDQPLPGIPFAVFGAEPADHLVITMDSGRAVRYGLSEIPLIGLQAINRRQGERISGALTVAPSQDIALVTEDGFGRRLPAEWVPAPPRPNSRGRVVVARRPLVGLALIGTGETTWAVSNQRLWPLGQDRLEVSPTNSTSTRRLFKLATAERILTAVTQ